MAARFQSQYDLTAYDATTLTQSRSFAAYFEDVVLLGADPKIAANWMLNQVSAALNAALQSGKSISIDQFCVSRAQLAKILEKVGNGTVNAKTAKTEIFDTLAARQGTYSAMWSEEHPDATADLVDQIIEANGLKQLNDAGALEKIVDDVIAANAKSVEEYKSGKDKAFNALVGQVMKASKGKANPAQASEMLKARLG